MTDTEMPAQDLEDDPAVKPLDDGVQAQQNQQSDAHHQVTAGDHTLTLPSDVPMTDVQPPSHDLPDVLVSSQDKISPASNGNDVRQDKVPEPKFDGPPEDKPVLESNPNGARGEKLPERRFGDGDGEMFERQPETATPLPLKKYPTHKSKHDISSKSKSVWTDVERGESDESGTPEERASFMKELETFYRENALEFKPPKFYGEPLNCLKLWRAVIKLGGYEVVTASKLWRQVGESFHPPKTCTTVSWTFRIFYEKALLEYEKHKRQNGELQLPGSPVHQSTNVEKETSGYQPPGSGSGRERRIAATRAMQGWHAQRLLGYGEISEPIIKDKNLNTATKREKPLKSIGIHKQKTNNMDPADKHGSNEADRELEPEIVDIGPPADWVKINVRETKDCYEVYALVPGLLREESLSSLILYFNWCLPGAAGALASVKGWAVCTIFKVRVQSDPVGRLIITGQPEQLDNPWGITPFKKVVVLPSRIDPLHTSAVVSLHGRLRVRVPFEQLSS